VGAGAGAWLPDGLAVGDDVGADMVADGMADGDMPGGGAADDVLGAAAGPACVLAGPEAGGAELTGAVVVGAGAACPAPMPADG
jgi:hypothetical protein